MTLNISIVRAPRKHLSWTSPGQWPLKMDKPWFFPDKPPKNVFYKISSNQDFTSKQTLILVSLLSFKNCNPIQEEMLSWLCTESNVNNLRHFTLYNALINKSEQVWILLFYTTILSTVRPSFYHTSARLPQTVIVPMLINSLFVQHHIVSKCSNC